MRNVGRLATILALSSLMAIQTACTKNEESVAEAPAELGAIAPQANAGATSLEAARDGQAPAVNPAGVNPQATSPSAPIAPFRTWVMIQRYTLENDGGHRPISNVKLELTFPNGAKLQVPEGGQYWPVGSGQVQEINRTFEIPWTHVEKADGFKFTVQMIRKGAPTHPCNFDVTQLSQFNRAYVCRTDTGWQATKSIAPENMHLEAVQVRVFSDRNSPANEIPREAIAKAK